MRENRVTIRLTMKLEIRNAAVVRKQRVWRNARKSRGGTPWSLLPIALASPPEQGVELKSFLFTIKLWEFPCLMLRIFLSWVLFLGFCTASAHALEISENFSFFKLTQGIEFLEDADHTLTAQKIIDDSTEFQMSQGIPSFGFRKSTYWFRAQVQNTAGRERPLVLEIAYPHIGSINVYEIRGKEILQKTHTGRDAIGHVDAVSYRNFNLPLILPKGESRTLLFELQTDGMIQFPLNIWSQAEFAKNVVQDTAILGLFYGVLIIMAIYNFFLFLSTRDKSYFFYVLYLISFGLFQLSLDGLGNQLFWGNYPWWGSRSIALGLALAQIFVFFIAVNYLQLHQMPVWFRKVFQGQWIFTVLFTVVLLFLPYSISIRIATVTTITCVITVLSCGIISYRAKYLPARFFILAFTSFALGATIYALKALGVLPSHPLVENAPRIGAALEMALLSIGLADRFNQLKKDKEIAQQEALALKDQLAQSLEKQVQERTASLHSALDQLKETQQNLVESEKKSALTVVSAGIAHELNNPLNYIAGGVPNLKRELVEVEHMILSVFDDEAGLEAEALAFRKILTDKFKNSRYILRDLETGVRKTSEVVEEIRGMTEVDGRVVERIVLADIIRRELLRARTLLIAEEIKKKIRVVLKNVPGLTLETNPFMFARSIRNVLHNAISFVILNSDAPEIRVEVKSEDSRVFIEISNNGPAIQPSEENRLFDLFYTTKQIGAGRGTGLSLARSLLENISGEVYLADNGILSGFVKFTIALPLVTAAANAQAVEVA